MSIFPTNGKFGSSSVPFANAVSFVYFLVVLGATVILSSCTASNMAEDLQTRNIVDSDNLADKPTVQQYVDNKVVQTPNAGLLVQNKNSPIKVEFPRIVGIPQSAASTLSSAIRRSAEINAITVIDEGQVGASFQIKGSFIALDEGSGTLLVFYWQILDNTGRIVYRITEQQRTSARNTDPWLAIDKPMIYSVVASSMKNMRIWMDYNI